MLTQKDRVIMEAAIELLGLLLNLAIEENDHDAASRVGELIDGLKDIKDR